MPSPLILSNSRAAPGLMEAECERRGLPEDWEVEVFERLRQQRQGDNSACTAP